jgi:hypothetical protein
VISLFVRKPGCPQGVAWLFYLGKRVAEMKRFSRVVLLFFVLGFLSHAEAALIDRGGGLIYDSVLNVTWLQDANYARNSGYGDGSGQMTWNQAKTWAANIEYFDAVRNVTWTEWRLPHILPINGSNYNLIYLNDGSTDEGSNISAPGTIYAGNTGSEMAYMFYNNLHNISYWDFSGNGGQPGWGLNNTGPFINLQANPPYWSSFADPDFSNMAWFFEFSGGYQTANYIDRTYYAWAVRDGDVAAVPEPSTMLLLGCGLIGLVGLRRKFKFSERRKK